MEHQSEFPQASDALSAIARAYELAERAVAEEPDAHRAFEMATEVTEAARQVTNRLGNCEHSKQPGYGTRNHCR